jgi:hypothetical protein
LREQIGRALVRPPNEESSVTELIKRIRHHLKDERIHNDDEADAEIELMSQVELVEVISFVLDDILAGRPTMGPGEFPGDRQRQRGSKGRRSRKRPAAHLQD